MISEREKNQLEDQLLGLQTEAEEACRGLEVALHKNSLLRNQGDSVLALQTQLEAERSVCGKLEMRMKQLIEGLQEREQQVTNLEIESSDLKIENAKLLADKAYNEAVINELKQQVYYIILLLLSFLPSIFQTTKDTSQYQTLHNELKASLDLIDELHAQLARAETAKESAKIVAEERLREKTLLEDKIQELSSHSVDLEEQVWVLSMTNYLSIFCEIFV